VAAVGRHCRYQAFCFGSLHTWVMTGEFGQAMRRWRERITPAEVGLPTGGRRRAPGLRREELGVLAGVSVDYVNRLEQGRATAPSAQVVEALARALRLTGDERDHLFRLAGLQPPGIGTVPAHLTPGVQRLLDRLSGTPVAACDATWTLLTANHLWTALMGDLPERRGHERNIAWRHFLGRPSRVDHTAPQLAAFELALAGDLRAAAGRYPADRGLRDLIGELRTGSDRFAELWDAGAIGPHEAARKTIVHPQVGRVELDCDILTVATSDLRIIAYTAEPGSESADRLALIAVVGTQSLI
jgi:transcriptional regulator with XRE-family HTH domain